MTDSPRVYAPLDPQESPILDRLLQIRSKLELLRADKSCYIKPDDVEALWEELLVQVHALNDVRINKRDEQNRVDTVLDDCFQLVSLGFMTIGRNSAAPAAYSHVSCIKRLLDHLEQAAFFSEKDLVTINNQMQEYRRKIDEHRATGDPHFITLLEARLDICQATISRLEAILNHLTPELKPHWEKLVSILRSLSACNVRSKFPKEEVEDLQRQLEQIKQEVNLLNCSVEEGKSLLDRYADKMRAATFIQDASAEQLVSDLLSRCILWAQIITEKPCYVCGRFKDVFEKLLNIRNQLESRSLLQAWSLRETDLFDYQRKLDRIDESRIEDGNFVDAEGKPADLQTQRTLLYLLRKSYVLIYFILSSSEPVSEALLPIFNQLKTLKKCLREVQKAGGVSSPRELFPYTMKLSSIDNMRTDGKFKVNGEIPEGQAAVNGLIEECFELAHELKAQAEKTDHAPEVGEKLEKSVSKSEQVLEAGIPA